jgi:hypothetical protein
MLESLFALNAAIHFVHQAHTKWNALKTQILSVQSVSNALLESMYLAACQILVEVVFPVQTNSSLSSVEILTMLRPFLFIPVLVMELSTTTVHGIVQIHTTALAIVASLAALHCALLDFIAHCAPLQQILFASNALTCPKMLDLCHLELPTMQIIVNQNVFKTFTLTTIPCGVCLVLSQYCAMLVNMFRLAQQIPTIIVRLAKVNQATQLTIKQGHAPSAVIQDIFSIVDSVPDATLAKHARVMRD